MTSQKNTRLALSRSFDDYVAYRTVSPSITMAQIDDQKMTPIQMEGAQDNSIVYDLGFTVNIDNREYNKFVVVRMGWMILLSVEDNSPSYTWSTWMDGDASNSYDTGHFRIDGFGAGNQVVLVPWASRLQETTDYETTSYIVPEVYRREHGLEKPELSFLNERNNRIRIFLDESHPEGRRRIVRWNCTNIAEYFYQSSTLRFEAIIYENGKIEFRYVPQNAIQSAGLSNDRAACLIFTSGTVERPSFRDFSKLLSYGMSRSSYENGANVYDASYLDISGSMSASYGWQLNVENNWPGSVDWAGGCSLTFSPPKAVRKLLRDNVTKDDSRLTTRFPRQTLVQTKNLSSHFDDRKIVTYSSDVVVNMPTTLTLFHGNETLACRDRQDLFTNLSVTSSVSKGASDSFVSDQERASYQPFSESALYEMSDAENDTFFASGSSRFHVDFDIKQPLRSKSKIQFSLPVNHKTLMLETISSIYYYNNAYSSWTYPKNSSYAVILNSTGSTDVDDALQSVFNNIQSSTNYVVNDYRGFGPIGNIVASGTMPMSFSLGTFLSGVMSTFTKSLTQNSAYTAESDEYLTIPITEPFLLEKAVFEVPIEAGPGWFRDLTTVFPPIFGNVSASAQLNQGSTVDFGGPALTLSLMHQQKSGLGELNTQRNVILTGTITHQYDNTLILSMSLMTTQSLSSSHKILHHQGFRSFGAEPSAVVFADATMSFTGSVIVKSEPSISNGAMVYYHGLNKTPAQVQALLSATYVTLDGVESNSEYKIGHINSIGRSGNGLEIDGRSIMGGEFSTPDNIKILSNPLHKSLYGNLGSETELAIAETNYTASITSAIPLFKSVSAPYLLMPGDKLILAMSKTRPFFWTDGSLDSVELRMTSESLPIKAGQLAVQYSTSGSYTHDIKLSSGTINVVLYGTTLRNSKQLNPIRSQNLLTNGIYEVSIGNESVVDQYEIEKRTLYAGTMFDDYITGSLASVTFNSQGQTILRTGSRGRVFSKLFAQDMPTPESTGYEALANPSYSFRLQPWFERVGTIRVSNATSDGENYYDSFVPSFLDCVNQNSARLVVYDSVIKVPAVMLDWPLLGFASDSEGYIDYDWSKSYPFEPRYASVQRVINFQNYATKTRVGGPTLSDYLKFDAIYLAVRNANSFYGDIAYDVTGSASLKPLSVSDAAKIIYGFGDFSTVGYSTGSLIGSTNMAEPRVKDYDALVDVGPVIRGWKYGLVSGEKLQTKVYYRQSKFGQFRDMLEQRPYTKFMQGAVEAGTANTSQSPVSIKFLDSKGVLTDPLNTWSSNLSNEATSSIPYCDGEPRNRPTINLNTINKGIIVFNSDINGNVSI